MKLHLLLISCFLFSIVGFLFAEAPDWILNIPYEEDAFLGVGSGLSIDEAQENARIDILMQLSSKVDSTMTMSGDMTAENIKVSEYCRAVISSSSLRGAEVAEVWQSGDIHYALLRYCDTCGSIIVTAALTSAVEVVNRQIERNIEQADIEDEPSAFIDLNTLIEEVNSVKSDDAVKLKRRLQGPAVPLLKLENETTEKDLIEDNETQSIDYESYTTKNLLVFVTDDKVIIRLVNFPPDSGDMTESQKTELRDLSVSLFQELVLMGYTGVTVVGHANPEGLEAEKEELEFLSRERAENLETFLLEAGIKIDGIEWKGGDELIGSTDSKEGRALNRRVDIYVHF